MCKINREIIYIQKLLKAWQCVRIYIYNKCDQHIQFLFYITTDTSIQKILLNITDISQKIFYKCCVKVEKVCTIIYIYIYIYIYITNYLMCGAIC